MTISSDTVKTINFSGGTDTLEHDSELFLFANKRAKYFDVCLDTQEHLEVLREYKLKHKDARIIILRLYPRHDFPYKWWYHNCKDLLIELQVDSMEIMFNAYYKKLLGNLPYMKRLTLDFTKFKSSFMVQNVKFKEPYHLGHIRYLEFLELHPQNDIVAVLNMFKTVYSLRITGSLTTHGLLTLVNSSKHLRVKKLSIKSDEWVDCIKQAAAIQTVLKELNILNFECLQA